MQQLLTHTTVALHRTEGAHPAHVRANFVHCLTVWKLYRNISPYYSLLFKKHSKKCALVLHCCHKQLSVARGEKRSIVSVKLYLQGLARVGQKCISWITSQSRTVDWILLRFVSFHVCCIVLSNKNENTTCRFQNTSTNQISLSNHLFNH